MYGGGSRGKCPENWQTAEILKWIQDNDDSKGDIKSRVMGVVQANDLDGHTLKQLVAEKDEIQNLFPALKERLAFKSMLRNLFKHSLPGHHTNKNISPPRRRINASRPPQTPSSSGHASSDVTKENSHG
ncbi:uncharacterized protein [Asterias amurensis]|uniref:uncharacterized protein n=1 Tax=Asterias amurensis TaxID=7602 RepID=UPI003AB84119